MRWPVLAAAILLAGPALAEELLAPPPKLALSLTERQTQLILETLKQISCPNVGQLIICQEAVALVLEIQRQTKEQIKMSEGPK